MAAACNQRVTEAARSEEWVRGPFSGEKRVLAYDVRGKYGHDQRQDWYDVKFVGRLIKSVGFVHVMLHCHADASSIQGNIRRVFGQVVAVPLSEVDRGGVDAFGSSAETKEGLLLLQSLVAAWLIITVI